MKIATDRALNLGDIFNAELPLEKKFTPIKVKCKVVRQKPFIDKFRPNQKTGKVELGAQFLDVDNFYRNRIFSFISQLQKQKTAAAKYKQKMTDMPF